MFFFLSATSPKTVGWSPWNFETWSKTCTPR